MNPIKALINQNNILKLIILAQAAEIAALKDTAEDAAYMIDLLRGTGEQRYG